MVIWNPVVLRFDNFTAPMPCLLWFFGVKKISVVQKTVQIKLLNKATKKHSSFKGSVNEISVYHKF